MFGGLPPGSVRGHSVGILVGILYSTNNPGALAVRVTAFYEMVISSAAGSRSSGASPKDITCPVDTTESNPPSRSTTSRAVSLYFDKNTETGPNTINDENGPAKTVARNTFLWTNKQTSPINVVTQAITQAASSRRASLFVETRVDVRTWTRPDIENDADGPVLSNPEHMAREISLRDSHNPGPMRKT